MATATLSRNTPPTPWRTWLLMLPFALGLPLFAACGGGGGAFESEAPPVAEEECDDASDPDCGEVLVALTDADGDFLSYSVDVVSLTLARGDGTEVETLPRRATVDFAQLVEVTELLSAATVPSGSYTGGTILLDYGDASISVESAGEAIAAVAVGADGAPVTTLELEIQFQGENLVVVRGTPALLTIDFDLNASHTVDLSVTPAEATVEPFLVASVDIEGSEDFRVRGPLDAVEEAAGSYTIVLRPFLMRTGAFGRATIHTTVDTVFEIDGVQHASADGLAVLAAKAPATATLAIGEYVVAERRFTAREVYAGSSVPGGNLDAVEGTVVARTGGVMTVKGATLIRAQASAVFNDEVTVTLGPDTQVVKAGVRDDSLDIGAISVGQRLTVFGTLTDDAPGSLALDATQGLARLNRTNLTGTVVGNDGDILVVDLQSIDLRQMSLFDFAGTGVTPADDADPANYEIDSGTLASDVTAAAPVRVIGFVTPFGAAPPDFEAVTVADFTNARAWLNVLWDEDGTTAPFASLSDTGMIVNLQNPELGDVHHLRRGAVFTDLFDLAASPLVAPPANGRGSYAILQDGVVQVFTTYAGFEDSLQDRLANGNGVRRLHAQGGYDAASSTLTARTIRLAME